VSEAEVKWMGDGIWAPESVCFDWTNDDFKVTYCTFDSDNCKEMKNWGKVALCVTLNVG